MRIYRMKTMHSIIAFVCRMFVLLICIHVFAGYGSSEILAVQPDSSAVSRLHPQAAPVVIWNRTIVVFRLNSEEISPGERAKFAIERMNQMPINLPEYRVVAVDGIEGGHRLAWVKVNGRIMFTLIEGEQDVANGESYAVYKERTVKAVESWLLARREQNGLPLLFQAFGLAVLATIVLGLTYFAVKRSIFWLMNHVNRLGTSSLRHFVIAGFNIGPYFVSLATGLVNIFQIVLLMFNGYLWLTFVLSVFPYTAPLSSKLSGFLVETVTGFSHGVMVAIPGFFVVGVIFYITRLLVRLLTAFFRAVEEEQIPLRWFEPETAKATRRIIVVLVWIFALVVAYPMIPGSQTKVFQGVSVFLGLMLSLGSAGLVGQLIGGIVAVYTRAFQSGDYVRIGDHEGVVQELGLLAAKIVTIRKEEITIPNALLMSSTTINYSRQAKVHGAIVTTEVTIGYDVPWRQVHAMLELAAERSAGIRKSPKPIVLQKALSDFYVQYSLMVTIDQPEVRYYMLSELHGHIQDLFNEYGVQIMSPNFVMQPDKEVVVPKEEWFAAPSRKEAGDSAENIA